jgi:hypothetical protein
MVVVQFTVANSHDAGFRVHHRLAGFFEAADGESRRA